jgi:hypothetical protein
VLHAVLIQLLLTNCFISCLTVPQRRLDRPALRNRRSSVRSRALLDFVGSHAPLAASICTDKECLRVAPDLPVSILSVESLSPVFSWGGRGEDFPETISIICFAISAMSPFVPIYFLVKRMRLPFRALLLHLPYQPLHLPCQRRTPERLQTARRILNI